jgi:hypothetical protein
VKTVKFKTVLDFFHIANLRNASSDEAMFSRILLQLQRGLLPPTEMLATFRRKNALSDIGRLTSCAADTVLGGNFALVHSRARGELTVPA